MFQYHVTQTLLSSVLDSFKGNANYFSSWIFHELDEIDNIRDFPTW